MVENNQASFSAVAVQCKSGDGSLQHGSGGGGHNNSISIQHCAAVVGPLWQCSQHPSRGFLVPMVWWGW